MPDVGLYTQAAVLFGASPNLSEQMAEVDVGTRGPERALSHTDERSHNWTTPGKMCESSGLLLKNMNMLVGMFHGREKIEQEDLPRIMAKELGTALWIPAVHQTSCHVIVRLRSVHADLTVSQIVVLGPLLLMLLVYWDWKQSIGTFSSAHYQMTDLVSPKDL